MQELIKKIEHVHPPEMGLGLTNRGGELVIKLQNGEVHSRKIDIAKGAPENSLSKEEMDNKYRDCVRLSLSPEDTDKSLRLLAHLESVDNIAEIMDIFTFGSAQS